MGFLQDAIAANLRLIREDAWSAVAEDAARLAVGVLTTENRNNWAAVRRLIVEGGAYVVAEERRHAAPFGHTHPHGEC